ncbi:hypothetical protein ES332_D07G161000v1 [Gossypium tomentosum]|nr:hypothetical protein ES332_D07G161000v1 [Gossypium tomentosum]
MGRAARPDSPSKILEGSALPSLFSPIRKSTSTDPPFHLRSSTAPPNSKIHLHSSTVALTVLLRLLPLNFKARQMVMFSATWPTAVHRLAQEYMDPNPVKVVIGSEDLAANHDVMQIVED